MEYFFATGPNAISPSTRIASGTTIFELIPDLFTVPGLAVTIQMLGRRICVVTTRLTAPGRPSNVCYAMSGLPGSAT
ncbi:hypothetical protein ACKLNR_004284 [Fusarium oxysporum f. sp. zingiberi]